eukprot:snap_masked-scaffold_44-processed-gene-1.28-mRNA-1 protein AED:1.00 eAED:1.00 QI:0/-1/0/0/-1/1/1/0/93
MLRKIFEESLEIKNPDFSLFQEKDVIEKSVNSIEKVKVVEGVVDQLFKEVEETMNNYYSQKKNEVQEIEQWFEKNKELVQDNCKKLVRDAKRN